MVSSFTWKSKETDFRECRPDKKRVGFSWGWSLIRSSMAVRLLNDLGFSVLGHYSMYQKTHAVKHAYSWGISVCVDLIMNAYGLWTLFLSSSFF